MGHIGSNSKEGLVKDNASAKKAARKSSRQTKLDRFFELEKDLKRMLAELREAAFEELQAAFQDLEFHLPIALVFVFGQPLLIAIFGLPDEDGQLPHEIGLLKKNFPKKILSEPRDARRNFGIRPVFVEILKENGVEMQGKCCQNLDFRV